MSLPKTGGIAQALSAGDNPHADMTGAQSALSSLPAAAIGGAYTAPTWAPVVAKLGWAGIKKYMDYTFLAHMLGKGGVP
jgi:hypothetical protein